MTIRNSIPCGLCFDYVFKSAVRHDLNDEKEIFFHGMIRDPNSDKYIWHGWIEENDFVDDLQTNEGLHERYPVELFYFYLKPKNVTAYSAREIIQNTVRVGHKGPWTSKELLRPARKYNPSLYNQLLRLRPKIARAAQEIYDEWQGEDDDLVGGGGICDEIANEISGVIASSIRGVEVFPGGQDGDDHAWTVAVLGSEAYGIDIPPSVYETGGGYSWKKLEDVTIVPDDVEIFDMSEFIDELRDEFT